MTLPLRMPFAPMEALSVEEIPVGPEWQYEPKWDGFRTLAFRDGQNRVAIEVRPSHDAVFPGTGRRHCGRSRRKKFVLDGEIAVPAGGGFSFDALLQRIHPAASRVRWLAVETPALFILFDLLVDADGRDAYRENVGGTAPRVGKFLQKTLAGVAAPTAVAGDDAARRRRRLAQARRRHARRRCRQAARSCLSLRRSHRHAEDQELPQRRLCGRRLSLQRRRRWSARCCSGFTIGRAAASRRLHLDYQARGQVGADQKAESSDRAAGFYRQRAGRSEPLVDRALGRVAAAQTEARGRGLLRPFFRRALPPWHAALALAAGQVAAAMHVRSGQAEEGKPAGAAGVTTGIT